MSTVNSQALAGALAALAASIKEEAPIGQTEVHRHDKPSIVLPRDLNAGDAAKRLVEYEKATTQEVRDFHRIIALSPEDALVALNRAIAEVFGFCRGEEIRGFFGTTPPTFISIETPDGEVYECPYGRLSIPGLTGFADISVLQPRPDVPEDPVGVSVNVVCQRKDQPAWRALFLRAKELAKTKSIYAGHPLKVSWSWQDSEDGYVVTRDGPMPFTSSIEPSDIILSDEVATQMATLWGLIEHTDKARRQGVPIRRGILLAGTYGTGKTMIAVATATLCQRHGWGFLLCSHVEDLQPAVVMAQQLKKPTVVFVEDIDRAMGGDARTVESDGILNTIDGLISKATEVVVVMTTNNLESLEPALLRPGRIDTLIVLDPPNESCVKRIILRYGGECLEPEPDLDEAVRCLAGSSASMVREAVERAKLHAIARGDDRGVLTGQDIAHAAAGLVAHQQAIDRAVRRRTEKTTQADRCAAILGKELGATLGATLKALCSGKPVDRIDMQVRMNSLPVGAED